MKVAIKKKSLCFFFVVFCFYALNRKTIIKIIIALFIGNLRNIKKITLPYLS